MTFLFTREVCQVSKIWKLWNFTGDADEEVIFMFKKKKKTIHKNENIFLRKTKFSCYPEYLKKRKNPRKEELINKIKKVVWFLI